MTKKIFLFVLFLFLSFFLFGQKVPNYSLSGSIYDSSDGQLINHAVITLIPEKTIIATDGTYRFSTIPQGGYRLAVNAIGYKTDTLKINLDRNLKLDFSLSPKDVALTEIVVTGYGIHRRNEYTSGPHPPIELMKTIVRPTLLDKPTTDFSKMLASIPGVNTMSVGAGVSKPMIRGLGFNRIATVNKGIVQQNQQWGADHGLEINIFDMQSVNLLKGANSLMYGSDAMGGVIDVSPFTFANKTDRSKPLNGEAVLWGATNNNQLGAALTTRYSTSKYLINGTYSYQDYADYRVPANTFVYSDTDFPLYNKRLKNTAGKEQNISLSGGYAFNKVKTVFSVSDNYQKYGFFAGGHGAPELEELQPDKSTRNMDVPYSNVNHFTLTNNTEWTLSSNLRMLLNVGYQDNHRQEYGHNHGHEDEHDAEVLSAIGDKVLEYDFSLKTYSSNIRFLMDEKKKWSKIVGGSVEYQQNKVGGEEFYLPEFKQIGGGVYFINNYRLSKAFAFTAGLRYDLTRLDIDGFFDEDLAHELIEEGYSPQEVSNKAQLAQHVNHNYSNLTGSVGAYYYRQSDKTDYVYATLGKSFRMPTAIELAANGMHHGALRYEIGNPDLDAEQGYSFDIGWEYDDLQKIEVKLNLFTNYFSNFIYLQHVDQTDLGSDDVYMQNQAKAVFGGGEYQFKWKPISQVALSTQGQYVINKNIDNQQALPFTPPFVMKNEAVYSLSQSRKIEYYMFSISHQWFANQHRVGLDELKTKGANLFNAAAGVDFKMNKNVMRLNLQLQNIFDTRYLNHLSFYRQLNIPEPGRNLQLFVRFSF